MACPMLTATRPGTCRTEEHLSRADHNSWDRTYSDSEKIEWPLAKSAARSPEPVKKAPACPPAKRRVPSFLYGLRAKGCFTPSAGIEYNTRAEEARAPSTRCPNRTRAIAAPS